MRASCAITSRGLLCVALVAVTAATARAQDSPPAWLVGTFEDDYGNRFTITAESWTQHPGAPYRIVDWNVKGEYVIARASAEEHWLRIDWIRLDGMAPYEWGFCISAWDATTRAAAEAVTIANRVTPRTGCNGYPFSRMRRASPDPPAM